MSHIPIKFVLQLQREEQSDDNCLPMAFDMLACGETNENIFKNVITDDEE
jgi:hypothetical protein